MEAIGGQEDSGSLESQARTQMPCWSFRQLGANRAEQSAGYPTRAFCSSGIRALYRWDYSPVP